MWKWKHPSSSAHNPTPHRYLIVRVWLYFFKGLLDCFGLCWASCAGRPFSGCGEQIETVSLALQGGYWTTGLPGSPIVRVFTLWLFHARGFWSLILAVYSGCKVPNFLRGVGSHTARLGGTSLLAVLSWWPQDCAGPRPSSRRIQTLVLFARLLPLPLHFFPVWLEPRAVWPLSSNLLHKLTLLSVLQRGNSPNAEISWFLPLGTPVFKKKKLEIAEREQKYLSTFPPQCWLPSVSFWPAKAL